MYIVLPNQAYKTLVTAVGVEAPGAVEALVRCGRLHLNAGRHKEAVHDLTRAFALCSGVKGPIAVSTTYIAGLLLTCCRALGDEPGALLWQDRLNHMHVAAECEMPDGTTWPALLT
jgi:hypothetical protein